MNERKIKLKTAVIIGVTVLIALIAAFVFGAINRVNSDKYELSSKDNIFDWSIYRFTKDGTQIDCIPDEKGVLYEFSNEEESYTYYMTRTIAVDLDDPMLCIKHQKGHYSVFIDGELIYTSSPVGGSLLSEINFPMEDMTEGSETFTLKPQSNGKELTVVFRYSDNGSEIQLPDVSYCNSATLIVSSFKTLSASYFTSALYIVLFIVTVIVHLIQLHNGIKDNLTPLLAWHILLSIFAFLGSLNIVTSDKMLSVFTQMSPALLSVAVIPIFLICCNFLNRRKKLFLVFVLANASCSLFYAVALAISNETITQYGLFFNNITLIAAYLVFSVLAVIEAVNKNHEMRILVFCNGVLWLSVFFCLAYSYLISNSQFAGIRIAFESIAAGDLTPFCSNIVMVVLITDVLAMLVYMYGRKFLAYTVEVRTIKVKNEAVDEYVAAIKRHRSEISEIRHDMSKHLDVAMLLLNNSEYEKLSVYLSGIATNVKQVTLGVHCDNVIINYYIGVYKDKCEQKQINFTCKAAVADNIGISEIDLCSLITNILENAYEASLPLEQSKRKIALAIFVENNVLRVRCENNYLYEPKLGNEGITTSKKDEKLHGFGIKIIEKVCEKYGGAATYTYKDGCFKLSAAVSCKSVDS